MKFILEQIKSARIKLAEKRFIEADKQLSAIESHIEDSINSLPVIRTDMKYWCEECQSLCAVYEQGLSCDCGNGRWETEVLDLKDYPKKWKKVKVNIYSV